ncbi:MAG: hypothetical protein GOV15_02310 [Candidatus Diapherotrites archaeon]|nr:hypothetical protein [Candidatus Diapherotrites archaeon]
MIELYYLLFGIAFGTVTGLIPGIHVNTVLAAIAILSASPFPNTESLLLFTTALAVTHSMLDHIPSILLGAPSQDSFLSVLPGHRLLMQKQGFKAIMLTVTGGVLASIITILLSPLTLLAVQQTIVQNKQIIPGILLLAMLATINSEKTTKKKITALLVTALAGSLGLLTWNAHFDFNPLFPALTGLFGLSTLFYSLFTETKIPLQKTSNFTIKFKPGMVNSFKAVMGGTIVGFLPALGPAQAAFAIKQLLGKINTDSYLLLLGGINTATTINAFLAMHYFGMNRSGAAAFVSNSVPTTTNPQLILILSATLFSVGCASLIALILARKIVKKVPSLNYFLLNLITLTTILGLVLALTNWQGLLIALTATSIGLISILTKVKRINATAFLTIPTLLFYLGL